MFNKLLSYRDLSELKEDIINIIKICLNIKVKFVIEDERDRHLRMHLNFGHTIGHGIERYFEYSKYTHGEGVSIGMSFWRTFIVPIWRPLFIFPTLSFHA